MGAIQSSINQVLGTTAAGVTLAKHVSEQKEANKLKEEENALAKEVQKKADIENAYDTFGDTGKELLEANESIDKLDVKKANINKEEKALADIMSTPGAMKRPEDWDAYAELSEKIQDDKDAAAYALHTLKMKKEAIGMRKERSEGVLRKAGLLGGSK